MKVDIPEPLVYVGIGVAVNEIVKSITGDDVVNTINKVLYNIERRQRLRKIEAKKVVDVMGDTIGYIGNNGNIVKGDLSDS